MGRRHTTTSWRLALLVLTGCCAVACTVEPLEASFLVVPSFRVQAADGQLPQTDAITDVRVVVDDESLGFYPLPATVPVLVNGRAKDVRLEATVRRSGIADTRVVYPMYSAFVGTRDLPEGLSDTIVPTIAYAPGVELAFEEGFEGGSRVFTTYPNASTSVNLDTSRRDARTGLAAGRVVFENVDQALEVTSAAFRPDADFGGEVWVELDYRGDAPLSVALLPGELGTLDDRIVRYEQGVLPRQDWGKLYFDLSSGINAELVGDEVRVGLLASGSDAAPFPQSVQVDNVKLLFR